MLRTRSTSWSATRSMCSPWLRHRSRDFPDGRLFGSGCVLDSARLRWLIGAKSGVAQQSVHAMMLGEHGDTEFPLWSQARIGTVPLREWTDRDGKRLFSGDVRAAIHDDVVHAAYKIIAGKGATNYAIGLSGARIVEAVLRDEHAVMPVSSTLARLPGDQRHRAQRAVRGRRQRDRAGARHPDGRARGRLAGPVGEHPARLVEEPRTGVAGARSGFDRSPRTRCLRRKPLSVRSRHD